MRFHVGVVALAIAVVMPAASLAVDLYVNDFEVDDTANWTKNGGVNVDDPAQSHVANYFFDYSTVGIPLAPHSAADDEPRGMKLQANMDWDFDGISGVPTGGVTGMSVSPNGVDISDDGDFKMTLDLWGNFPGPFPVGSNGTSQMSTFGFGTTGISPNYPGSADGLFFAATVDGGSTSDYRAYSIERSVSYQFPADPTVLDLLGQPIDGHATYHAAGRNNTAALYADNFGGATAPEAQLALFPQQTGAVAAGALGMEWHVVEITKVGNIVTWDVDDVTLITLDITNIVTPLAGGNILFGMSDINAGASNDLLRFDLLFTLIDNIKVETYVPPENTPDFNGDNVINAADYPIWRNNLGLTGTATQATGDANGDTNVDDVDYDLWKAAYGDVLEIGSGSVAGGAVPEPATLGLMVIGLAVLAGRRRQRG